MTAKKPGRPPKGSTDGEMKKITFRVDEETFAALQKLEANFPVGTVAWGRRSQLLRKLILDAANRSAP